MSRGPDFRGGSHYRPHRPSRAERQYAAEQSARYVALVGTRVSVLMDGPERVVTGTVLRFIEPACIGATTQGHLSWHRMLDVEIDGEGVWRVDVERVVKT